MRASSAAVLLICAAIAYAHWDKPPPASGPFAELVASRIRAETGGSRRALMTLATNGQYAETVSVLAYSYRRVHPRSNHSLVVMVRATVPEDAVELLSVLFDRVVEVEELDFGSVGTSVTDSWLKLRAWQFVEYERVVYLGGDTLILRPIRALFQCPPPCGVYDGYLWETAESGTSINGDVFVLRPSLPDFARLAEWAAVWDDRRDVMGPRPRTWLAAHEAPCEGRRQNTFVGPYDQGLLNRYFGRNITVLPLEFNFMPYTLLSQEGSFDRRFLAMEAARVRVAHYAIVKPWSARAEYAELQEPWFRMWREARAEMRDWLCRERSLCAL
eukprot:tig00000219_g19532.t1